MEASFRSQHEQRGRRLSLMGEAIQDLNRDDLYAVIGFLVEVSGEEKIKAALAQYTSPQPSTAPHSACEYPPSNNGLIEG